jgi:hypothetical protein
MKLKEHGQIQKDPINIVDKVFLVSIQEGERLLVSVWGDEGPVIGPLLFQGQGRLTLSWQSEEVGELPADETS